MPLKAGALAEHLEGKTKPNPCGLYVDTYSHYVGDQTNFPTSSSINLPSGAVVAVLGNFVIDSDIAYKNVIFEMEPGKEIYVKWNVSLTLEGCTIYSCDGRWNGIRMESSSKIYTESSEIYFAVRAISYDNEAFGLLSIENTYFQDNDIGLFLRNSTASPVPLSVTAFSGNSIVGGVNYPSSTGIYVENMPLIFPFSNSGTKNSIIDMEKGILARNCPIIDINSTDFDRLNIGIDYDKGTTRLFDCKFINNVVTGLQIGRCQSALIDFCLFDWDSGLKAVAAEATHYGIKINEMMTSCNVTVNRSTFAASFTAMQPDIAKLQYVTGVFINGNNAGGNTLIDISDTNGINQFNINAIKSRGIHLSGSFPASCTTRIIGNTFKMGTTYAVSFPPCGILCDNGTKHNLNIRENIFESVNIPSDLLYGIELSGAVTLPSPSNELTLNKFPGNYRSGIRIFNYKNTMVCSNTFYDKGRIGIFCSGLDNGTKLQLNKTYFPRLIEITPSGVIGNQFMVNANQSVTAFGNEWHYSFLAGFNSLFYVTPQVLNQNPNPVVSGRFIVHTLRSGDPAIPGSPFFPAHPFTISPDPSIQPWFNYRPLTTVISTCVRDDKVLEENDEKVADGSLSSTLEPASLWEWERYLYDNLAANPEWANDKPAYNTFMAAKTGTPLARLYEIGRRIEQAHAGQAALSAQIEEKNVIAQHLTTELKQMLGTVTPGETIALNTLRNKQEQLAEAWDETKKLLQIYEEATAQAYRSASQIAIQSTSSPEQYLYAAYRAYLARYAHPDRSLPDDTLQLLSHIASLCPRTAGAGVYMARSILTDIHPHLSYNDNNEDCYLEKDDSMEEEVEERTASMTETASIVYPNPANNTFSVRVSGESGGSVTLLNTLGQVATRQTFALGTRQLLVEGNFAPGLYRLLVVYENGTQKSTNLTIAK